MPLKINKRFMADMLLLSDSCVMRVYPDLLEEGWLVEKDGFVCVTDKGSRMAVNIFWASAVKKEGKIWEAYFDWPNMAYFTFLTVENFCRYS